MLKNHFLALAITLGIAFLWLRINDYFANKGWISSHISRKLIHIGTGPIYVLCWLLFPESDLSPYLAALVPLIISAQFTLVGLGIIQDPAAVKAMSRTGRRKEILRGPLYYGLVFVFLTILFWRNTPDGIIALMILCGGDGLADVVGKRFGKLHLPWSKRKTVLGSITMFAGGFVFSVLILSVFISQGNFSGSVLDYSFKLAVISITATIVESLPFSDIDNITVPITAIIIANLVF